jgi:hypothetical protein
MTEIYQMNFRSDFSLLQILVVCSHMLSFIIIIIVVVVILVIHVTFMQGIYNYVPETKHISRVCNITAVLYLQFGLHATLFCP